jgi:hypothetical protein
MSALTERIVMATNRLTYTAPSLIAAATGLGVALLIIGPVGQDPHPAPTSTPATAVHTLQEDDPGWDCTLNGNRVCGDPQGAHATDAWAAWDKGEGWRRLNVDPSKPFRVDYVGTATQWPSVDPRTEVAVPARTGWYVFRAVVTDGK